MINYMNKHVHEFIYNTFKAKNNLGFEGGGGLNPTGLLTIQWPQASSKLPGKV